MLQNVGDIKVKWHCPLPEGAIIRHIVLLRSFNKWYICWQIERPDVERPAHAGEAIRVDVDLLNLLALSNSETVVNPRWLRKTLVKIRVAQRRLSCRKRGSRRRKAAFQMAKLHRKVAETRHNFWHKEMGRLANAYSLIAVENLTLEFLTQNEHLALNTHDAALGMFRQLVGYKVEQTGSRLVLVNPQHTSQGCSGCGAFVPKAWSVRVHACPHCSLTIERDVNAAHNILKLALKRLGLSRQDIMWRVGACVF